MNNTPERIHIDGLMLRCILGTEEAERREKQDVVIDIVLSADLRAACRSDDIADTVDYKEIKKNVVRMTERSDFHLVERLAEEIARICLEHPLVQKAVVRVAKPGALRFARSVGIEIERTR